MPPLLEDMTDPDRPVTRRELREELEALFAMLATKDDLQAFATKDDLKAMRDELRTHFDVVAEDFKKQFGMLYDWAHANVDSLAKRVEIIEDGHGGRLLAMETRVTRLEHQK